MTESMALMPAVAKDNPWPAIIQLVEQPYPDEINKTRRKQQSKKRSTMIHNDIDWADLSRNVINHHVKKSASTGLEYTENAAAADIA